MNRIKKFQIFNESQTFGKLLGNISKGVSKMKWLIGKTGNDEDLAEEILTYLSKLPTDYIKTLDFKRDRVYKPMDSNYVFFLVKYLKEITRLNIELMLYRHLIHLLVYTIIHIGSL